MADEDIKSSPSVAPFLIDQQPIGNYEISNKTFVEAHEQEAESKPSFLETARKTFPENAIYRNFMAVRDELLTISEMVEDPNQKFNFFQEQYMSQLDPEYWPEASMVKTEAQFFRKVAEIGQRQEARQARQESGGWNQFWADAASGAVNPLYYAPVANGLRTLEFMPAMKQLFTRSIPSAMVGVGIDEADLYFNHQMRTQQEALMNTLVAGGFTGLLGGVGFGARSLKLNTYKSLIQEQFKGSDVKFRINEKREVQGFTITNDSAGSASTRHLDLVNESIYGWGANGELHAASLPIWLGAKVFQNPILRGLTSKSPSVRGFVNDMLEHNLDLTMIEKDFIAPPEALQTAIANKQIQTFNFQREMAESYYKYLGIDPEKGFLTKVALSKYRNMNAAEKPLNYSQFSKEVYIATVEGGDHKIPVIKETANSLIDKYLNPIYEELVENEILPPNLTPAMAAQHVMRVYDRPFIKGNEHKVLEFLTDKFTQTNERLKKINYPIDQANVEINRLRKEVKSMKDGETKVKIQKEIERLKVQRDLYKKSLDEKIKTNSHPEELTADMIVGTAKKRKLRAVKSPEDISASAQDAINTILGLTEEQMNESIVGFLSSGTSGTNSLKRRTLMISDKEMIELGMLNGDIRVAFGAYNLRMARITEMNKYLKQQGYKPGEGKPLEFLTANIANDYQSIKNNLEEKYKTDIQGKSEKVATKIETKYQKERINLEKAQRRDVETISTIYKRLMGQTGVKYGSLLKLVNSSKKWLYSTELGALTLLQLQDIAAPIYRMGFKRYLQHGVAPFLRNMAALDFKANAKLRESAQHLSLGIDSAQAFYNMNFSFERDSFVPLNMIEKTADFSANAMGILNLSSGTGDILQHISATATQSSIITDLRKAVAGTLSDKYRKRLLNLRIQPDSQLGTEILRQAEKHGSWKRGAVDPNWHLWDISTPLQREAKKLFQGAIRKEVRATMFSGSNLASFPIGGEPNGMLGAFIMYAGWGLNAVTNFTIPMFQKLDVNRLSSALLMIAISSTVEPIRAFSSGREVKDEDLELGSLFKNGVLNSGVLGAFAEVFNKLNTMGDIVPDARVDRFKNTRGLIQFGPERIVADIANLVGMMANNEYNKKDIKRLVKNLGPLGNVLWMRKLVNDWLDQMEVPETREKAAKLKEWR